MAGLLDLLAPLDYPRQAAANMVRGVGRAFEGEATADDYLGMLPGALGVGAGLAGLGPLGMAIAAGLGQGAGNLTGMEAFDAPTVQETVGAMGGDPESLIQNLGAQLLTDPLTIASAGPLFSGKLPRRILGGFALPEAPNPTSLQGTALPIKPPIGATPGLNPEALSAAALAREAELARPLPPITGAGPTGVDPLEGLYRIHADMLQDLTPLPERYGVMADIVNAQSGLPVAPGRAGDLTGIADDLMSLDQFLLQRDVGRGARSLNLPGEFTQSPYMQIGNMDSVGSLTNKIDNMWLTSDDAALPLFHRTMDLTNPAPSGLLAPTEVARFASDLSARGFPVNPAGMAQDYAQSAKYPLQSIFEVLRRPQAHDPAYIEQLTARLAQLTGPESMGSLMEQIRGLPVEAGRYGGWQLSDAGMTPLIEALMGQMRSRTGLL